MTLVTVTSDILNKHLKSFSIKLVENIWLLPLGNQFHLQSSYDTNKTCCLMLYKSNLSHATTMQKVIIPIRFQLLFHILPPFFRFIYGRQSPFVSMRPPERFLTNEGETTKYLLQRKTFSKSFTYLSRSANTNFRNLRSRKTMPCS